MKAKGTNKRKPGKKLTSAMDLAKQVFGDDDPLVDELGERLEKTAVVRKLFALRCACRVSQQEIAEKLNCSQSVVSKLENGTDDGLTLGKLKAYASALGLDVSLVLRRRNTSSVDRIKHHAFAIKHELECLTELAQKDSSLAKGISEFFGEATFNLLRILLDNASNLPECNNEHREHEDEMEVDVDPAILEDMTVRRIKMA